MKEKNKIYCVRQINTIGIVEEEYYFYDMIDAQKFFYKKINLIKNNKCFAKKDDVDYLDDSSYAKIKSIDEDCLEFTYALWVSYSNENGYEEDIEYGNLQLVRFKIR